MYIMKENDQGTKNNQIQVENKTICEPLNKVKSLVHNILTANKQLLSKQSLQINPPISKSQNSKKNVNRQSQSEIQSELQSTNKQEEVIFEVNPTELVFTNVKAGNTYYLDFIVTNISNYRQKIQFHQPYCKKLIFENITIANLAPGISKKCRVYYEAETDEEMNEVLLIVSDKMRYEMHIKITKEERILELIYEPAMDLGPVPLGTTFTVKKIFENQSSQPININLCHNQYMLIKDDINGITIDPRSTKELEFLCNFQELGFFEATIGLEINGKVDHHKLKVTAKVSNPTLDIVDANHKQIDKLDFGNFFSGQTIKRKVFLKNTSDLNVNFELKVLEGSKIDMDFNDCKFETPQEVGKALLRKVVFLDREKGTVPSNGTFEINIEIRSRKTENEKLLVSNFCMSEFPGKEDEFRKLGKQEYDFLCLVTYDDLSKEPIHFQLAGVSNIPLANFGTSQVIFDDVTLGGHSFVNLKLSNFEQNSNIQIQLPKDPDFFFDVDRINLKPMEQIQLVSAYCPKVIGAHKKYLTFDINGFKVKCFFVGFCSLDVSKTLALPTITTQSQKSLFNQKLAIQQQRGVKLAKLNDHSQQRSNSTTKTSLPNLNQTSSVPKLSKELYDKLQQTNCLSKIAVLEKAREDDVMGKKILKKEEDNQLSDRNSKSIKHIKRPNMRFLPDPRRRIEELPMVPKSHEETKQVSQKLEPEKLLMINVGPTELNFGQVFINSTSSLFFQVKNDMLTSISVQVYCNDILELKESYQKMQIVPGGKTAGFRITLRPSEVKNFQQAVKYIINGFHQFQFLVKAAIIPVDLILSRNNIVFKFREDSSDTSISEVINIRNPGNCPAKYTAISQPNSSFSFAKHEGVIPENSARDIEIIYTPKSFKEEDVLNFQIENGTTKTLKVTGICNEISCDLVQASVNLGSIAVFDKKSAVFSFRNTHKKNLLIYRILEETIPEGMTILNTQGKGFSEELSKIEFDFILSRRIELRSHEIHMMVRGLGILKLYFSVNVVIPIINIEQKQFNFDKVTLSTKVDTPLRLMNDSKISAEVFLDLCSQNPYLQEKYDCVEIEAAPGISIDSLQFETKKGAPTFIRKKSIDSIRDVPNNRFQKQEVQNEEIANNMTDILGERQEKGKHYIFHLKPGAKLDLVLKFLPMKPIKYDFELKFALPGQELEGNIIRRVTAIGVSPTFILTPVNRILDFERKTVYLNDSPITYSKFFLLKNPSAKNKLNWKVIAKKESTVDSFTIPVESGVINENESMKIVFDFRPLKPGTYQQIYTLELEEEETNSIEIIVKGSSAYPSIIFSKEEILLTPVPLGVQSISYFDMINDGYQNTNINLRIPQDIQKLGLAVEFKDNTMIGIATPKLGLKITFMTTLPLSFSIKLIIEDDYQRQFTIIISGASDNSILTYAPYLIFGQFYEHAFNKLLQNETNDKIHSSLEVAKGIVFDQKSQTHQLIDVEMDFTGSQNEISNETNSYNLKKFNRVEKRLHKMQEYFSGVSRQLLNWLNDYGFSLINRFPEDLILSNGTVLYEFIDFLVKVPFQKCQIDKNSKAFEQIKQLLSWYNTVLTFLKENNAMVNLVRPQFLLSHRDFQIYVKIGRSNNIQVANEYFNLSESDYRLISLITWTNLFFQIIKVFFINKIGISDFKEALKPILDIANNNINNQNTQMVDHLSVPPAILESDFQKGKRNSNTSNLIELSHTESLSSFQRPRVQPIQINFPQIQKEISNSKNSCFSQSELYILKWVEICCEVRLGKIQKQSGFDKNLCLLDNIAALLELYLGSETKIADNIKQKLAADEYKTAFLQIKNLLLDFGLRSELEIEDFKIGNQIFCLFFFMHLFRVLPNYLPKQTIEFECILHEKVQKEISLNSPSQKMIIYTVKLFGDPNFTTNIDLVKIEGKENIIVPIMFQAQTSLPVEGKLLFQNHRNGKTVAAAVAFNLKARVTQRISSKIFNINNAYLYELNSTEILIKNPFEKNVEFKVTLENRIQTDVPSIKQQQKGGKDNNRSGDSIKSAPRPSTFFIKNDKIQIRKGASSRITVYYLPLFLETTKANLILLDPKVGEIQYELVGNPIIPMPQQEFIIVRTFEQYGQFEVQIPIQNVSLHNAITKILEKLKEFKAFDQQMIFEKIQSMQEVQYKVELEPNELLSVSNSTVKLNSSQTSRQQAGKKLSIMQQEDFSILLNPLKKIPMKELSINFNIKGLYGFDLRTYTLVLTVNPKPVKGILEMTTTARIPISQMIPVINQQPFDCTLSFSVVPILNDNLFDIQTHSTVLKKESQYNLLVKFKSMWIAKAECRVLIQNTTTNELFEYHIKAVAEEPLSEDNISIKTRAKNPTEISFPIKNPIPESKVFTVETDFNEANYPAEIQFDPKDNYNFKMTYTPMIGGSFMNSITFKDKSGKYFWYVISSEVDSPDSIKLLRIQNEIRKPAVLKIELPVVTKLSYFHVIFVGNYLSGEEDFQLKANEVGIYDLIYYPFQIENDRKRIGFLSEEAGEYWYDVDCKSEESKVVRLNSLKAQLGKTAQTSVVLHNPLKTSSIMIELQKYDNSLFTCDATRFELGPNVEKEVFINYSPNDMNKQDSELFVFKSDLIGDWKFHVSGTGVEPQPFDTVSLSSSLQTSVTRTLFFKNPLSRDALLNIGLEGDKINKEAFEIIVPRQKSLLLQAGSLTQIVVRFCPNRILNYKASIQLRLTENVAWVYPLRGTTETLVSQEEKIIKAKCGSEFSTIVEFNLYGDEEEVENSQLKENKEESEYSLDSKIIFLCKQKEIFEKWVNFELLPRTREDGSRVKFKFNFTPLKAFKAQAEFVILKTSGGQWKYKMIFESTDPDFFDTLVIHSKLNCKKTIQFRLFNNDKKNSSSFSAFFTNDSDPEFFVSPSKGVIEPPIKDGSIFEVSYLPTQYGKEKKGTLIIETESFMWRFCVKGRFEKYIPPSNAKKLELKK